MPVEMITGNQAAALAVQQAGVDLVSAYPITPQTAIVEDIADFWARGELGGEFVSVESEYAALSYCCGASAAGARTFTATSSHGLAFMHEMTHWIAGARLPVVMAVVNRALGAPWCLDPDQGDSLSQRDTGWIQLYCASAQEIFDTILQAFPLSESLLLPCMVVLDGFYLSHTYEAVELPEPEQVKRFVEPPRFAAQVDPLQPANMHGLASGEEVSRLVRERHRDLQRVPAVLKEINERFAAIFGRRYAPAEGKALEGAETVVVTAGSIYETVVSALPGLDKTGMIRIKVFRPFPAEELRSLLKKSEARRIIVIDRNCSPGAGGILAQELKSALYNDGSGPLVQNLLLAGGIDLSPQMLRQLVMEAPADCSGDLIMEQWGVDLR
ncbi:MAG: pyruvate ferredoxin oxidoreductase [Dethiobacteria bacterium]